MLFPPKLHQSDRPGGPGWKLLSAALVLLGLLALMLLPERAGDRADQPLLRGVASASLKGDRAAGPDPLWAGRGFRLAQVKRGARVPVYERPGRGLVERARGETEFGSPQVFGVVGRRGRWLEVTTPISTENRTLWIRAERRRLRFGTTTWSVHVDLGARSAELRRGGGVERRFPVTVGAAASSTPTGRFAITDTITEGLNPVYGCCALALSARQTDLPPGWTGGDRVAIHGTTGPVGTAASNGCIRAANGDARALLGALPLGAPVFIRR
jgi:hypothetical protein